MEAILEGIGDGFISLDPEWRFTYFNSASEAFFGFSRSEVLGEVMWERFPVLIGTEFELRYRFAMAERLKQEFEVPSAVVPGRILEVRAFPCETGLGISFRDITESGRVARALRESEARFRHMADSAPALIWMTSETGRLTFANMHFDHVFGVPAASLLGSAWTELVLPEDLEPFKARFRDALRNRVPLVTEIRARDSTKAVRWLRINSVPRLDDEGNFLGYTACAFDLTDLRYAEAQQQVLLHELDHRVKNTLAVVQAVVQQTLRRSDNLKDARQQIDERLVALSKANALLTREKMESADLRELLRDVAAPHEGDAGTRIDLVGPAVKLSPRTALALSLALHELATNAAKYGALSNDSGRVTVTWTVTPGDTGRKLQLRWIESSGPQVHPPTRSGFGSYLLSRVLTQDVGGQVRFEYPPSGLVFEFDVELPVSTP